MTGFLLPRAALPARVTLTTGKPRAGTIFVGARVPQHDGPETPLEMLNRPFGQKLWAKRREIECLFGNCTSFGGGLAPLPAWVRRLRRVKRWVWAKLLINAVRIQIRQRLVA